jgi:D-beta-D-heptose 7-phosphate kinase/D-beta-D-heptose 1-phosphate adenosyltransferase
VLVVDARSLARYRGLCPTAVKPNYAEALELIGARPGLTHDRVGVLASTGPALLQRTNASICAVTLDIDGALVFTRDRTPYRTYARRAPEALSTGAGDTFAAALTLALAAGADARSAAELASSAAQAVVGRDGTVACTQAELRRIRGDRRDGAAALALR